MSNTRTTKTGARQRLIETAERLFYSKGIRAVGIDKIIHEAGVAKMTLYNHFASKDDLILAVLQHREKQVDEMFSRAIERHVQDGKNRLEGFFGALKAWFEEPSFRGCSFINASVELADAEHPACQFSAAHKRRVHTMLREIVKEVAGEKAETLTPAIALLVEGAIVTAQIERSSEPADVAKDATLALVAQAKTR
ncbi:MAG: TetR/AcrR family transcriptional regulator [Gemmataceae bacterium]